MAQVLTDSLFPCILNMSGAASLVIVCVLLARLLLRRAPKCFSYALWAAVLFRLIFPISIPASFSLLGVVDTPSRQALPYTTAVEYVRREAPAAGVGEISKEPIRQPQGQAALPTPVQTQADPLEGALTAAAWIWAAGALALAGWGLVSYVRLRRRLVGSLSLGDGVYLADHIPTPFVLGLFRPRVYLPAGLSGAEQTYILRHESYHIYRLDHLVRLVSYLLLCLHWFNPLVWAAYVLSGKDMEMSCDEAVIKDLGEEVRADYSACLLRLATGRRLAAGIPLAFGEGDTGSRIRNLVRWRRPKRWVALAAALLCIAVTAACVANPRQNPGDTPAAQATPTPQSTPPVSSPTPAGDPADLTWLEETVNAMLVGAQSWDESWPNPGPYALTVSGDGRTDTYTVEPGVCYTILDSPGRRLAEGYRWTTAPSDWAPPAQGYTIRADGSGIALTAYTEADVLEIEVDGVKTILLGEPVYDSPVCSFLLEEARNARYAYELSTLCRVEGDGMNYDAVAQALAQQYVQAVLDRPGWMTNRVEDAKVSGASVFDAYYGDETPSFCFGLGLDIRVTEAQRGDWEAGSGLSEPPDSGPNAGYYGWGVEAEARQQADGSWVIAGMGTGGVRVELPYELDTATAEQLTGLYFLTSGNTHDWRILYHLAERPLEEVQQVMATLPADLQQELRQGILAFMEEYPDYCTWSPDDFA